MINKAVNLVHAVKSFQILANNFSLQPVFQSTGDSMARASSDNGGYFSTT